MGTNMKHNANTAGPLLNLHPPETRHTIAPVIKMETVNRASHAVWKEFQAGMYVLRKYACHSSANSTAIAKSNLQLLHRTLLKDPDYSQRLQAASSKGAKSSLPTSHCVFANHELRADILTLQSGTAIQLNAHDERFAMYLSITGKSLIQPEKAPLPITRKWWERPRLPQGVESLKNGDAVVVNHKGNRNKQIIADKSDCILLRIQLPVMH